MADLPDQAPREIAVKNPAGEVVTIPPEQVHDAIAQGYTAATPEEYQQAAHENTMEAQYGSGLGNTAAAFAEGAGRGLLPGIAPELEKAAGVSEEAMRERQARHGVASTAGELAGMAGGIAATEGLGALGAAGEAAEGVGAATKAAEVAEKATEAAPIATRFAKSAALSAAYGVGNDLNEAELGNADLNAEKLFWDAGANAIFGLGAEGLLSLGEKVVPKVISKAADAAQGLQRSALNAFDSLSEKLTGRAVGEAGQTIDQSARSLADSLNEHMESTQDLMSDLNGKARPSEAAQMLHDHPVEIAGKGYSGVLDQAETSLNQLKSNPDVFSYRAPIQAAENAIAYGRKELANATTSADVYRVGQEVKGMVGDAVKFGKNIQPGPVADTLNAVKQQIWTPFKDALSDEKIFAGQGARNAAVNSVQNQVLTAWAKVFKALGMKEQTNTGAIAQKISASKVATALRSWGTDKASGDIAKKALDDLISATNKLHEVAGETFKNASMAAPDVEKYRDLLERISQQRQAGEGIARSAAASAKSGPGLLGGESYGSLGSMGMVGHALGLGGALPLAGAAAAVKAGASALRNPLAVHEAFARINASTAKVSGAIGNAVSSFLRNPVARETATTATSTGTLSQRQLAAGSQGRMPGDQPIDRRMAEVARLASNPQLAEATINRNTNRLTDTAPQTAQALKNTSMNALFVMAQALPRPSNQGILNEQPPISQSQAAQFERLHNVLTKPLSMLEDMKEGVLTSDLVGAVSRVFPNTMAEIRQKLQGDIMDHPSRTYTMGQKLQMSVLMGEPVDGTTDPRLWATAQQNYATSGSSSAPAQGALKPTTGGASKLKLAEGQMTVAQSSQSKSGGAEA